jgi:single-stranded DNA-binding protein
MASDINFTGQSGYITTNPIYEKGTDKPSVLRWLLLGRKEWKHNGELKSKDSPHCCIAFAAQADALAKVLQKGQRVFVEGEIDYNQYFKGETKLVGNNIIVKKVTYLFAGVGRETTTKINDTPYEWERDDKV